ncbi:DUF6171 family protein [Aquibacillus rhizosphaerae]|uniref:DUF6171 family protein n=1 Tax=Aquibacillus rhizosphaerae TaxID=3051431 RepID=A0ABT7LAP1_9BACI|nr:DUF6171 family protein [Aquibacillus sp. LR5S19]MDL4842270.1 DUF6171 family protein [Aquibacillus sp. LR5S19]
MTCKGCSASVVVSEEEIDKLIEEQLQFEIDIADDELYKYRLDFCKECPSLLYNTTCSHCGCFVKFRAKLAYKRCPYPSGAKW